MQETQQTIQKEEKGHSVGHYILGKTLGEGTFGKVKLGTHILTGEKVAVKVLEKSKIKDKKDVERISREIKILKKLHHPNVVQIYEIIETERDLYLVMEYAPGGELFDLIVQNQRLKENKASKHFQELVAGVHYIHKLGICHRDLKPENLLVDFDGCIKMVDFGLSNTYENGQTLKTACGSPCYAAPEMIAGHKYNGLKSDIWSIGVVLYAMLCGYLPYEDQKTSNLYKKILSADYTLPKFLSADAKDIIQKIFQTDPDQRIDIDGIRRHPFYTLYQPENQNFSFHTKKLTVNSKLVQKMEQNMNFNAEQIEQAVQNNKHNHLSATYYLLLKKYTAQAHRMKEQSTKDPKKHQKQSIEAANIQNKSKINNDQIRQPVQDVLVLKNHRREQSANATAGRTQNNEWGSEEDIRRGASYEKPNKNDEYQIIKERYHAQNDTEKRSNFMSPSPETIKKELFMSSTGTSKRKGSSTNAANQFLNTSYIKPVKEVALVNSTTLNISNVKQQLQNYTNQQHMMAQTINSGNSTLKNSRNSQPQNKTQESLKRPSSNSRQANQSSALSTHKKNKSIDQGKSQTSQSKNASPHLRASSQPKPSSNNQNIAHLMNNLNLLSQKSYFDSIVNKHLRSKEQPISSNESRSKTNEPKNNFSSKNQKPGSRTSQNKQSISIDKEMISRTIEAEKETFRSNLASANNQERRFNGTQPIQPQIQLIQSIQKASSKSPMQQKTIKAQERKSSSVQRNSNKIYSEAQTSLTVNTNGQMIPVQEQDKKRGQSQKVSKNDQMRHSLQPSSNNPSSTLQATLRNNLYKSYEKPVEKLTLDSKLTRKDHDVPAYNNYIFDSLENTYSPDNQYRQKSSQVKVDSKLSSGVVPAPGAYSKGSYTYQPVTSTQAYKFYQSNPMSFNDPSTLLLSDPRRY